MGFVTRVSPSFIIQIDDEWIFTHSIRPVSTYKMYFVRPKNMYKAYAQYTSYEEALEAAKLLKGDSIVCSTEALVEVLPVVPVETHRVTKY